MAKNDMALLLIGALFLFNKKSTTDLGTTADTTSGHTTVDTVTPLVNPNQTLSPDAVVSPWGYPYQPQSTAPVPAYVPPQNIPQPLGNTVLTFAQVLAGATSSPQYSSIPNTQPQNPNQTQPHIDIGNTTIYRDNNGNPIYVRG